jgi:hypothetical protein
VSERGKNIIFGKGEGRINIVSGPKYRPLLLGEHTSVQWESE